MTAFRATLLCIALVPCTCALPAQRPADLAARIERIEHLNLADLLYHRDSGLLDALAADWSTKQLRALLGDDDPKVRAIALVVLHEQLGPRAMPELLQHLDDTAQAPPARETFSAPAGRGGPANALRPQTVGYLASSLLGQYLSLPLLMPHIGPENRIGAAQLRAGYADYVRTRRDRPHCLVWLQVALQRAGGGITPTPAERVPKIEAVRREIDAIPAPERNWYLLVLGNSFSQMDRQALVTEDELVGAARALGPDSLLKVLRGVGPADAPDHDPKLDPDLTAVRHGPFCWEGVAGFLLRHGAELIPSERLGDWLELEKLHAAKRSGGLGGGNFGIQSADWRIVAAELQPERAWEHLEAGFAALSDPYLARERGRLMLAVASRFGERGLARAVAWFYDEPPEPGFLLALQRAENARLFWAIVGDPRLAKLPWGAIPALARACNAQAAGPVRFADDALRSLSHPLGLGVVDFHDDRYRPRSPGVTVADAFAKHPEATQRLERQIAELRERLRELAAQQRK